jgi:predicted RNA binding protein YcfA (HicA-like mRNA interferase family)
MSKYVRSLRDLGARYGYTGMEWRGSGHVALIHPTAGRVIASTTPSDDRALRNVERDLIQRLRSTGAKA